MRFLIILGFLLGFGGVLSASVLVPWGAHERVRARATVAQNGGRIESFLIRLPADRIAATGAGEAESLIDDPVSRVTPPEGLAETEFTVEQYKLRNVDGDVIGVAMRHWTRVAGVGSGAWAVSIPGRGTLVWNSDGDVATELANALSAAGARSGIDWHGELTLDATANSRKGSIVTGTQEFGGVTGAVDERWNISSVSGAGELRGTIVLDTVVNQSS